MAWNPSPKISDCRTIAAKWKKDIIVVLAFNVHEGTFETVSYGKTRRLCNQGKRFMNIAHEAILEKGGG